MIKPTFTLDELIAKVRQLSNDNPDFVYEYGQSSYGTPTCSYIKGGDPDKPGCIFGRAIVELQPDMYEYFVENDKNAISDHIVDYWQMTPYDDPRAEWCNIVQECQDSKWSWQDAIKEGDKWL